MNAAVRHVEFGELTEEQMRVHRAGEALHRDGASPAGALELLAAIIEDRTWEQVADAKGRSFTGRFREFVEARTPFGLGFDANQLPGVISLRHPHESTPRVAERMAAMRAAVSQELLAAIPPVAAHGEIGGGHARVYDIKTDPPSVLPSTRPDSAMHVIARLKRDDPGLAERVVRGEVSPNAAAREMGWRRPRIILSTPERVAASLRKWMPREALTRLAELLSEPEDKGED